YLAMVAGLAGAGAGLGLATSPVAATVIDASAADRRGSASALVIILRLIGMTIGVSVLTLWGVQRQQALRRAGATDPLAASDPQQFLVNVAARVIDETFLFAVAACTLGLLLALFLRRNPRALASAEQQPATQAQQPIRELVEHSQSDAKEYK
ncbi:MAG TPA: hypothetical protein VFU22_33755, partial [Roseiflexaceae bacterium]|nr:hypothetical protein [Roseiflexaceae bacterium]